MEPRLYVVKSGREKLLLTSDLGNAINFAKSQQSKGILTIWSPREVLLCCVVNGNEYQCEKLPTEDEPTLKIAGETTVSAQLVIRRTDVAQVTVHYPPDMPTDALGKITDELIHSMGWRFNWSDLPAYITIEPLMVSAEPQLDVSCVS